MQSRQLATAIDGVLLLDKPLGLSSNTALQHVKRLFTAAKAGHVGTLDPLATGLLPVCLGEATKFSTDLFAADKTYLADVRLGLSTTTGDAEGKTTGQCVVDVDRAGILRALQMFIGSISQTPPAYSALKHHGKPLYAYARRGEKVEIAARTVIVRSIDLVDWSGERLRLLVKCGKGTYIRVLAEDIGAALGCGASLAALRRLAVGTFSVDSALTFDALEKMPLSERCSSLLSIDRLVESLPVCVLNDESAWRVHAGQVTVYGGSLAPGAVRLYDTRNCFLGIGEVLANGALAPRRMVATPAARSASGARTHIS